MDTVKLYGKFLAIHLKSAMAYRGSFLLSCLGAVLVTANVFLGVVFLMARFETIQGYTLPQLTLGFAVILMATSLAECFARGLVSFSQVLAQAQFDRILVRPRGLLFQLLCQDMKPTMLARVLQAAVMMFFSVRSGAVEWTATKALVLVLKILCGAAVFFGLFLVNATLCFFTTEGLEVMNIFTDGPREYGKYPFGVYGKPVLLVLTFLVPLALVQHWPLQYLLDLGPGLYGLLPVVSLLFLLPCWGLSRLRVRHYRSTGS